MKPSMCACSRLNAGSTSSLWPSLARVFFAFRGGRFLSLGRLLSGPLHVQRGVVAGCSFATTFIRVFGLDAFDSIPVAPRLELDIYIDDCGLSASGSRSNVIQAIVSGSVALRTAITNMLGCSLALDRVCTVASNHNIGTAVFKRLKSLAGPVGDSAVNLG
eukprot:7365051-Pyramimonas_sp.AAC.1